MIARLWHGRMHAAKAARYRAYLLKFEPAVLHYEVVGGGPSVDPGTGS